ncbi:hypothetical protein [Kitasatospora sp. NBC_01266]|uniref:hypothetical protein n=1 Tax=Kitasatospora sp. NBC_01266 TaxID=2903572 RepID=UPI002E3476D8|nr:hypothetical protein [Kitasatospora sp. NBC_01266]
MINEPTELHSQAAALALLVDLTENATAAGVVAAPIWTVCGAVVTGTLYSADDSALRTLDCWRQLLGAHGSSDRRTEAVDGARTIRTATAQLGDGLRVTLLASVPATVQAAVTVTGIEVAA